MEYVFVIYLFLVSVSIQKIYLYTFPNIVIVSCLKTIFNRKQTSTKIFILALTQREIIEICVKLKAIETTSVLLLR